MRSIIILLLLPILLCLVDANYVVELTSIHQNDGNETFINEYSFPELHNAMEFVENRMNNDTSCHLLGATINTGLLNMISVQHNVLACQSKKTELCDGLNFGISNSFLYELLKIITQEFVQFCSNNEDETICEIFHKNVDPIYKLTTNSSYEDYDQFLHKLSSLCESTSDDEFIISYPTLGYIEMSSSVYFSL
jgi:hypothetical protein